MIPTLWGWGMTFLLTGVIGRGFHRSMIPDVCSRKIVDFEGHDSDESACVAHLVKRAALVEGVHARANKNVLQGDNSAALKATTMPAMLHWLGVKPLYSRPHVSDDNAYAKALFRTAKCRPEFPLTGLADLEQARTWARSPFLGAHSYFTRCQDVLSAMRGVWWCAPDGGGAAVQPISGGQRGSRSPGACRG